MIKTLRKKFIIIAMLSIGLVLLVIIGGINIANYVNLNRSAEQLLDLLEKGGGKFPNDLDERRTPPPAAPPQDPDSSGTARSASPGNSPKINRDKFGMFPGKTHLPAEAAYKSRYFTVTLKTDGTVYAIDTSRIHVTSSDQAQQYALELFQKGKKEGFLNHYKYRCIEDPSDKTNRCLYIFLDCEQDFITFRSFLFSSIFFSLLGLLVVFLLVVFFSGKALLPVSESYAKQKRFITDASHELKTPLTIIDANTEILEMTGEENEWTQSIRNQVRRLTDLTEKLVFLSRMDEENHTLHPVDFSLSDALDDTLSLFYAVTQANKLSLQCDIEPDLTLRGDEGLIRQMFSLLIDNAMKYTSGSGEIRIALKGGGRSRRLTIWNTVDEIAPGNHNELFDRFYRQDASRNSQTGGHGIGLSVVQTIVHAHHGKINCHSADAHSIQFTITLPAHPDPV